MDRLVNKSPSMAGRKSDIELIRAYELMRGKFGHLKWWPGETPFEVCVGAILTQNTNWGNVEKAIENLKVAAVLAPAIMYNLPEKELASLIRPAGYFNIKAKRLRSFLRVLVEEYDGELQRLFAGAMATVRNRLLAIRGVGPETADSMLLYAGNHASFVIDAYTKRIFSRHGWCSADVTYDELQSMCQNNLSHLSGLEKLDYWQDYHAQLVMIGKTYCRPRDLKCAACPLNSLLPPLEIRSGVKAVD